MTKWLDLYGICFIYLQYFRIILKSCIFKFITGWETCDSVCIMKVCCWRKYLAIILFNFVM